MLLSMLSLAGQLVIKPAGCLQPRWRLAALHILVVVLHAVIRTLKIAC